jgi:hypothetical protein
LGVGEDLQGDFAFGFFLDQVSKLSGIAGLRLVGHADVGILDDNRLVLRVCSRSERDAQAEKRQKLFHETPI